MINIATLANKYRNEQTNVYCVVDQEFLSGFNSNQGPFMLFTYYNLYKCYCEKNGYRPNDMDVFLKNARRKRIKIIQQCCPYCGQVNIMFITESIKRCDSMKYCVSCGKKSTSQIIFEEVAAFIRVNTVHRAGLQVLRETYTASDEIMGCDVRLNEVVQLATILETTLREFYVDLVCMKHRCYQDEFLIASVRKQIKNDFMNIDKANEHYKKALDINLKDIISQDVRLSLKDLMEVRNIAVHNNGKIDEKFKRSNTYFRLRQCVKGDFIFIHPEIIAIFLSSVLELANAISAIYQNYFHKEKFSMISNYYFNLDNVNEIAEMTSVLFSCEKNETGKNMLVTF